MRYQEIIAEATDDFARWFGNSKVVDVAGDPLVVYHGTGVRFDVFDLSKSPEGFFFTDNRERAMIYGEGGHIMAAYLSIQRPAPFKAYAAWAGHGWIRAREEMMKRGYDGLITREDSGTTYVAFRSEQIRLVDRAAP